MKRSYIKIYGPPVLKAVKALEKVAVDVPEVCIMHNEIVDIPTGTASFGGDSDYSAGIQTYFAGVGIEIPLERCSKIISKSGEELGEYNFFFEWFKDPTVQELNSLIEKIDAALTPLGCRYTMTTK